jgi:hypothetical protein
MQSAASQITTYTHSRWDYFLIWGHGLAYENEIIDEINKVNDFKIIKILYHKPNNLEKFVRDVYSFDYAPLNHLKNKTRYLLTTPKKICIILLINKLPQEIVAGKGAFRHIESRQIKSVKEAIRNKYNPKVNGIRSENHVIHASDNESQTHHLLRAIGIKQGLNHFKKTPNIILGGPHHLPCFSSFSIKSIDTRNLRCNILEGPHNKPFIKLVPVSETPHYHFARGNPDAYTEYLNKYKGNQLTDYYSLTKFTDLCRSVSFSNYLTSSNIILVKEICNQTYQILDGVHRTAILYSQKVFFLPVAIMRI